MFQHWNCIGMTITDLHVQPGKERDAVALVRVLKRQTKNTSSMSLASNIVWCISRFALGLLIFWTFNCTFNDFPHWKFYLSIFNFFITFILSCNYCQFFSCNCYMLSKHNTNKAIAHTKLYKCYFCFVCVSINTADFSTLYINCFSACRGRFRTINTSPAFLPRS